MTAQQILTIAKQRLDIENAYNPQLDDYKSVYNTLLYVMTDERAIRNGMDMVDDMRRFDYFLGCFDARVDEGTAHIANWLHIIIVNLAELEKAGLITIA